MNPMDQCKYCKNQCVVKIIRPERPGDIIQKTAPVKVCPRCDAGEPPRPQGTP